MILMLPLDLCRLTVDSWRMTLDGYGHRVKARRPDQPCPFCRGCDSGTVPRTMALQIRYWNIWLLWVLHPGLVWAEPVKGLRLVPVCEEEGGYLYTPWYLPAVAVGLTLMWVTLILWSLWSANFVSAEEKTQVLEWIGNISMTNDK